MIKINGFLHRERLYDIINRWFLNDFDSGDPFAIKQIINFNAISLKFYLEKLSIRIFKRLHSQPIIKIPIRQKSEIKNAIVENPMITNPRIKNLIELYKAFPENYYLETPIEGNIYYILSQGSKLFIGSNRMKRIKRIAEKGSRKIIDLLFSEILKRAEQKAEERAKKLGIDKRFLISSIQEMEEEFIESEKEVQRLLKERMYPVTNSQIDINDVGGIKIINTERSIDKIMAVLNDMPFIKIKEVEKHKGNYNATNIIADYYINKDEVVQNPPPDTILRVLEERGMSRFDISRYWRNFFYSAEDSISIEFIISSYEDLIESEIGISMHENMIIHFRQKQEYIGLLAKNVEYLLEFIFQFALSPKTNLKEIPIKLWGKYFPDYFEILKRGLYGIPTEFGI